MPNPLKFSSKKKFIESCISTVIKEGKDKDQAVAQCYNMWENRKKKASIVFDSNGDEVIGETNKNE